MELLLAPIGLTEEVDQEEVRNLVDLLMLPTVAVNDAMIVAVVVDCKTCTEIVRSFVVVVGHQDLVVVVVALVHHHY